MTSFDNSAFDVLVEEGILPIAEIAKKIGSNPRALKRWASEGLTLGNGETVKLEHVRFPGRVMSSLPAVKRFIDKYVTGLVET